MKNLLILILLLPLPVLAQKRILVSPTGDATYLTRDMSAREIVRKEIASKTAAQACSDKFTFGYSLAAYPDANVLFEAFHRDIMAMWYISPASGTIDTVFVYNLDVGTLDSTVTVRLFNSNIYPGSGPGYNGYPAPGKLCWGYYISTNDLDNGLAAFPEDATDTTWYSTVPGGTPSFSPMGTEIWGFGGFPKVMHAFTTNVIALAELATCEVTAGQPFFITIRMYGPHREQEDDLRTGYLAVNEPESLETHDWKFYEHIYQGPGFTCPGWVARGDFNFIIWYSMTVTTNIPPSFSNVTRIDNTFDTGPQPVQVDIIDCDPETPSSAGVEDAYLRYSINGISQPDIPLIYLGGDTWEATLPGGDVDDRYSYRFVASDSTGASDSTATIQYRIVGLTNAWYGADTGAACTEEDIRSTGTSVVNSSFFVPGFPGSGTLPMDDGTSGPYDMGHNFMVFGDTFRYAWIGVNGAIALSKSPADTLDVNSNGFASNLWDFPFPQKDGRGDTTGADNMPGMLIAPFWADMIVEDTAGTYGRIVYGDNGDSCLFIVEWDSLGSFNSMGPISDATTFRIVLNRCTGTVDFQYVNVGTLGLDSAALVGMQADSNAVSGPDPGWIYVNRHTYPFEAKPRNNWCVRLSPVIGSTVLDGWNMVALSMTPNDGDYYKNSIFPATTDPGAISAGFKYDGGYVASDSLIPGKGYWLKFDGEGRAGASPATFLECVTAQVQDKWNIVGGPSGYISTGSISTGGGTTVNSSFFGYGEAGYYAASVLEPGKAYWVKVDGNGTLGMCGSESVPKTEPDRFADLPPGVVNHLNVSDAAGRTGTLYMAGREAIGRSPEVYELPPLPPEGAFDIRFGSGRWLETIPPTDELTGGTILPVRIRGAAYPVTISWDISPETVEGRDFTLRTGSGSHQTETGMYSSGRRVISTPQTVEVSITASGHQNAPREFSLGQNYPNPFNPVTRLTYDIPRAAHVRLTVFDVLGREITLLVDEEKEAGSYGITWQGTDESGRIVPSGLYILRMVSDGFEMSRKLLLLR